MNHMHQRTFRLALAVTLASTLVMVIDWPLGFLTPVLAVNLLKGKDQPPTLKSAMVMIAIILATLVTGTVFSSWFLDLPLLATILLSIMFFWIYYLTNLQKLNRFLGLMLIIGITIIPLMWQQSSALAMGITYGFVISAVAAIAFVYIAYFCFPHTGPVQLSAEAITPDNSERSFARHNAFISTMMVMPAVIYIIGWELSNLALVIVFIAILSLNPNLEQGKKASAGILLGNLLGGVFALIFYQLISTVPQLIFYVPLLGLFSLFISRKIAASDNKAPLWEMALTNMLVLTGPVLAASGGEVSDKFSDRIMQLALVVVYVLMVMRVLHTLIPYQSTLHSKSP